MILEGRSDDAALKERDAGHEIASPSESTTSRSRIWGTLCVVVLGLLASLVLFRTLTVQHRGLVDAQFDLDAQLAANTIELRLMSGLDAMRSLMAFYASSREVERHEFRAFCRELRKGRGDFIRAFEWAERVPREVRDEQEQRVRAEAAGLRNGDELPGAGGSDVAELRALREALGVYAIHGGSEEGEPDEATAREESFPVTFVEPLLQNERALGFDLASEGSRLEAIQKARDTGAPAATGRISLVQESDAALAFLVVGPVYENREVPATVEGRRRALQGVVVGVFQAGVIFADILDTPDEVGLHMRLVDASEPDRERVLFAYPQRELEGQVGEAPPGGERRFEFTRTLAMGGRSWRLEFAPTTQYVAARGTWGPLSALVLGACSTGLLAGYVLLLAKINDRIRRRVIQGTRDLKAANAELRRRIAESERLTVALRSSDERFDLAVKGSSDGIWDWDVLTNEVYYSPRFKQLLGYRDEEFEHRFSSWESRLHPEDREATLSLLQAHIEGREPYNPEYRLKTKDQGYRWFLARGEAVWDESGRAVRVAGSITDITDKKHAERRLARQTEELARSNRDLEEFAYLASHDLRAPLRAIANLSEWIEEDLRDSLTGESRRHLELMRARVRRMEKLVDDLLTYSRAGRGRDDSEEVSLDKLLENVVFLLNPPPDYTVEIHQPMPTLITQRTPLEQVFSNLIGNAVKHRDRGGGRADVSARKKSECWEFVVADDGPGIAPEFHERIFKMFHTLQPRDWVEGSGMGLALVKKLVERQGGRISVDSHPGRGATFHFTWPESPPTEERSE